MIAKVPVQALVTQPKLLMWALFCDNNVNVTVLILVILESLT